MEASQRAPNREVTLSPAEEAYLRRFVRRHALSGPAGRAVVAVALLALGLALWSRDDRPAVAPAVDGAALDAEIDALRRELAARSAVAAADPTATASVAELARRIEAIVREITALRARLEAAPAPARAEARPPPVGTDAAAVGERLYNLELRQSQAESSRGKLEQELLARLHDLELRQEERERQEASALHSLLDRVHQLESSREVAEARRLETQSSVLLRLDALESRLAGVPAAPQP